jgi:hypothetical protein
MIPACGHDVLMYFTDSQSGDNEALPMKTEPKSTYQISAEKRKAALVSAPSKSVIPCDQRGMYEAVQQLAQLPCNS